MAFAALACVATSAQPPPPQLPPPAVQVVPRHAACAVVTPVACRYDATRYAVKLSARKVAPGACRVRVGQVYSVPQAGDNMPVVDQTVVDLDDKQASLFGAWGRLAPSKNAATVKVAADPAGTADPLNAAIAGTILPVHPRARVLVQQHGSDPDGTTSDDSLVEMDCLPGFSDDTAPPAQVAQ